MKRLILTSLLLSLAMMLAACGSSHHTQQHVVVPPQPAIVEQYLVEIDALSENDTSNKTFVVKPGRDDISESDLRYREFARITSNALRMRGLADAESLDKADIVVAINYGVEDARHFLFPEYTQTPQPRPADDQAPAYDNGYPRNTEFTCYAFTQAEDAKSWRDAHAQSRKDHDAKAPAKPLDRRLMWETRIATNCLSGDLRRAYPALMLVAYPYFGLNSYGRRQYLLALQENDPRLHPLLAYAWAPPAQSTAPAAQPEPSVASSAATVAEPAPAAPASAKASESPAPKSEKKAEPAPSATKQSTPAPKKPVSEKKATNNPHK